MKCPKCGSTKIQRWSCPLYAKPFSPYNNDTLLCTNCRHRESIEKGSIPNNWNNY